ncbi:MAG: Nramp family divalent metal transporter [Acidobacteriota bacterium]|nr:Nramp family divalent metal transporter [Acidobacteriota bacterium]
MTIRDRLRNIGPAALVTAAFIGPGTVTTCTLAGAKFGTALLWGLLFSVIATVVLQDMSARLGIIGRRSLGEAIRESARSRWARLPAVILVLSAIVAGNAAYETGNVLGGAMGLETLSGWRGFPVGGFDVNAWALIIGAAAFGLLLWGNYRTIERSLVALVVLMSLAFLTTAVMVGPKPGELLNGLAVPSLPPGSLLTLVGLIGTTVVPYNLFLHASAVRERWKDPRDIRAARLDIGIAIPLGGIVSMAIVVTSAASFYGAPAEIGGAADMAVQLEPLMGAWARIFLSLGLFAAGITSAVTAPLAAAYAADGILGWKAGRKDPRFRMVWMGIIAIGMFFSQAGSSPVQAILFAQAANGILLPLVVVYLLWVMNRAAIMGPRSNTWAANLAGAFVLLITMMLGLRSLLHVLRLI